MYDPKTVSSPFTPQTAPGQFQRSAPNQNKPKIKMNKFWEELLLKKDTDLVAFVASPDTLFESLIDGSKKPYMEYPVHKTIIKDSSGKETYPEVVCTCGRDRYNKLPCIGCFQFEHFQKKPNPWKAALKTKWLVVHLAWYKSVPRLDKDNKQVIFNDVPQFNIVRCDGPEEGAFFGRLMKLTLGQQHTRNLFTVGESRKKDDPQNSIRRELYWTCSGCSTRIVTEKLFCEGCDTILMDGLKGKSWEEVEKLLCTPIKCSCGHEGIPVEGSGCGYKVVEGSAGKVKVKNAACPFEAPVRMDLMNVVMEIKKEGEKQESTLKRAQVYSIFEGAASYPLSDEEYSYLEETYKLPRMTISDIIAQAVERNGGLFNLEQEVKDLMYPVEVQAEILKVPNPYANASIPEHKEPVTQQVPAFANKGTMGIKFPNK